MEFVDVMVNIVVILCCIGMFILILGPTIISLSIYLENRSQKRLTAFV